jgi:hypothetical protein
MQCKCAIFSSVASPALQYFSTLFQNHKILEKGIQKEMFVLTSSARLSDAFVFLRRSERDMIQKVEMIFTQIIRYYFQM